MSNLRNTYNKQARQATLHTIPTNYDMIRLFTTKDVLTFLSHKYLENVVDVTATCSLYLRIIECGMSMLLYPKHQVAYQGTRKHKDNIRSDYLCDIKTVPTTNRKINLPCLMNPDPSLSYFNINTITFVTSPIHLRQYRYL